SRHFRHKVFYGGDALARKILQYLFQSPSVTHANFDLGSPSLSNQHTAQFGATLRPHVGIKKQWL
ncbi:hypothetical protein KYJ26_22660, partial [Bacillus sp. MCCB 382]|uniref:hypothetical protein n=1 Tax=Bacillus sp. MCCB 382 TaxID=2860197 RepID=UPI001C5A21AE|nr:hypothetical protein [Bacillus sp. MCCB 382]